MDPIGIHMLYGSKFDTPLHRDGNSIEKAKDTGEIQCLFLAITLKVN